MTEEQKRRAAEGRQLRAAEGKRLARRLEQQRRADERQAEEEKRQERLQEQEEGFRKRLALHKERLLEEQRRAEERRAEEEKRLALHKKRLLEEQRQAKERRAEEEKKLAEIKRQVEAQRRADLSRVPPPRIASRSSLSRGIPRGVSFSSWEQQRVQQREQEEAQQREQQRQLVKQQRQLEAQKRALLEAQQAEQIRQLEAKRAADLGRVPPPRIRELITAAEKETGFTWLSRRVKAPPGKLELTLDSFQGCQGAFIEKVHSSCPFRGKVLQGDLIVEVNGRDVSEMTLETLIAEIASSGADRNLVILRQFPVPKYSSLQPAAKKRKTGDDPQIDPHPEKSRDFPDAIVAYDKVVAVLSSDQQDEQSLTTSMLSYNPLTKAYFLAILWVCFGD